MTHLEEKDIQNKLNGFLAEKIFELLHLELNCQIYKTGHESLFPHLTQFANSRKRDYHEEYNSKDYKEIKNDFDALGVPDDMFEKEDIGRIRFRKSTMGVKLTSNPDFTIITPAGCIEQFEIKFRTNGALTEEEQLKYLRHGSNIFVVMPVEPFIKILKIINRTHFSIEKVISEPTEEDEMWVKYIELKRTSNNSLCFESSPLKSEQLIYPGEVLKKYEEIIKRRFK